MERSRHQEELLRVLNHAFAAGRADSVLAAIQEEASAGPLTARLSNLEGLCLAELGRPAEAVRAFERGLQTSYDRAELHVNLAVVLVEMSALGRALAEFEEGIRLDPTSVDGHLGYGRLLTRFRRYESARRALDRARELAPQDERVQRARAELFESMGDAAAAAEVWRWLESRSPTAESSRRLAAALRESEPSRSAEFFERCAQRDPAALDCLEAAAELRLSLGDAAGCQRLLTPRAEEISAAAFHNLCLALQSSGRARDLESLVARRLPPLGPTWGVVALARREADRPEAALEAVRRGLSMAPDDDSLANLEAVLLYDLGQREEARARWIEILARSPENEDAKKNLEQLFPR